MPGVNRPPGHIGPILGNISNNVRALSGQQQMTISDLYGRPVMNFGMVPSSNPPRYGIRMLDESGNEIAFQGGDANGNAYGVPHSTGVEGPFLTSSTSYADLGFSTIDQALGGSKGLSVEVGANILENGGTGGAVGVFVNGVQIPNDWLSFATTDAANAQFGRTGTVYLPSLATASTVSVTLQFRAIGPATSTVQFNGVTLTVTSI